MIRNLINLGGILLEWYIACSLFDALHPRKFSKKTSLLLGAALAEATAIYGLIGAILIMVLLK